MILLEGDIIGNPLVVPHENKETPSVLQSKATTLNVALRNTLDSIDTKITKLLKKWVFPTDIDEYKTLLKNSDTEVSSVLLWIKEDLIEPKSFKIPFTGFYIWFWMRSSEPVNFQQLIDRGYLSETSYIDLGIDQEVLDMISRNICRVGSVFQITETWEGNIFVYKDKEGDSSDIRPNRYGKPVYIPWELIPVKA